MNAKSLKSLWQMTIATVALTAISALGFDTTTVADLEVWLKADAGVTTNAAGAVTAWADQSGNGHDGAPSATGNPTYEPSASSLGTMPALRFSGTDSGITLGDLRAYFPSAATLFMVVDISADDGTYNLFTTVGNNGYWCWDGDYRTYPSVFRAARLEGYGPMPRSGKALFQVESSAALWRMFVNGTSLGNAAAGYSAGDANGYRIGYGPGAGGFKGRIAEVLVYARALSAAESVKVGAYLVDKYELGLPIVDPDLPAIDNAGGAAAVTANSAKLQGNLIRTGSTDTVVSVYYGTTDGGTEPNDWDAAHTFGTSVTNLPQAYGYVASSLVADTGYFYTYAASNATETVWTKTRETFITGDVWLDKTADASEIGLQPGTVMVYRAAGATNCALKVNYRQSGGTAVSNQDFVAVSGQLTLPVGATSTPLVITPLANWARQTDSTLELTLQPGGYLIGTASNASLTIVNESGPMAPTNAWVATSAGNASDAGNWGLGHAPQPGEFVLLGEYSQQDMTWDVTNAVAAWIQTADYSGTVTIGTRYDDAFTCLTIAGDCHVLGGSWTQIGNPAGNSEVYRLRVDVGGDFTLGGSATINLNEKGFAANYYGGYGPGRIGYGSNYERGASHGGLGGKAGHDVSWDKVYGSITSPTNLGSSSHIAGGGALHLTAQGTATIDGAVSATAAANTAYMAAAAGGSILMELGYLSGTGTVSVAGQNSGAGGGSGGGWTDIRNSA